MVFRLVVFLLVLAGGYLGYEIYRFHGFYSEIRDAPSFQIQGPGKADLVLVEFLDYNCPHCQAMHKIVAAALEQRPGVRHVVRLVPGVNESSARVIRLALAAGLQGRFEAVHEALLSHPQGFLQEAQIRAAVEGAGLDFAQLETQSQSAEVQKLFEDNLRAALMIELQSTPTFLVGRAIYQPQGRLPDMKEFLRIMDDAAK